MVFKTVVTIQTRQAEEHSLVEHADLGQSLCVFARHAKLSMKKILQLHVDTDQL